MIRGSFGFCSWEKMKNYIAFLRHNQQHLMCSHTALTGVLLLSPPIGEVWGSLSDPICLPKFLGSYQTYLLFLLPGTTPLGTVINLFHHWPVQATTQGECVYLVIKDNKGSIFLRLNPSYIIIQWEFFLDFKRPEGQKTSPGKTRCPEG